MLLLPLLILISALYSYENHNFLALAHITFTLLSCLYFIKVKSYQLLVITTLLLLISAWLNSHSEPVKNYQVGQEFSFRTTLFISDNVKKCEHPVWYSAFMLLEEQFTPALLQKKIRLHLPAKNIDKSIVFSSLNEQKGILTAWLVSGTGNINKIQYAHPKGTWSQKKLYREGVYAELWLKTSSNQFTLQKQEKTTLTVVIKRLQNLLDSRFNEYKSWAFSRALILGNTHYLTNTDVWQIRFLGLSHLFVVSGLHVGFIYLLAKQFATIIWRGMPEFILLGINNQHLLVLLISTPFILFYGELTEWGEPVQRAAIMLITWQFARLLQVNIPSYAILALALIIICLWQPQAIHSAGLWLSFCLVLLILYYVHSRQRRLTDWFKIQLMLSLAAIGLTLGWQESISFYSVFVNVIMVPFTGFIWFPVILFACLETWLLQSEWIMLILDYLLSYVFIFLDFIRLHSAVMILAQVDSLSMKVFAFLLVLFWVIYERINKASYLLLFMVGVLTSNSIQNSMRSLSVMSQSTIWWLTHESNTLRLYDADKQLQLNTAWANSPKELVYFWLEEQLLPQQMVGAIIVPKIFIWPFGNSLLKPVLLKQLAPRWLLLKEFPTPQQQALLTGLQIDWLVVTKKQSIKIEFWQDYWYIRHSNCLITINLQQQKHCQRVAKLENMLN